MTEYQFYEFRAIDRPLGPGQLRALRAYSTRARITPTSFVNDYAWGSFKGDEDAWMDRYFDAFLYVANWGTRILKLRLSKRLLSLAAVRAFCRGDSFRARASSGNIILTYTSSGEDGGEWVEGEGLLASMIATRAELARGDRRALYLGWLACAQSGDLVDTDQEPTVPAGLGQLSAPLEKLAAFLRLDPDLVRVAAQASDELDESVPDERTVRARLAAMPVRERDAMLVRLVTTEDPGVVASELRQRFARAPRARTRAPRAREARTVGELLQAVEPGRKKMPRRLGGRLRRRSSRDLHAIVDRIVTLLKSHREGLRAEEIRAELGVEPRELPKPILYALEAQRIVKKGHRRATTYFAR